MVTTTAVESSELLEELRDTFLASGCSAGEFESLLSRRHLPDWCLQWMDYDDQHHSRRLQDLFDQYLPPFSLLEIEVRNDADEETGRALISIVERKTGNGHFSATVFMLASTDSQFLDWGNLHFTDLKDYDVHFCKKAAGKCTSKPRSKTLGWYHVSRFRLVTVKMACEVRWMVDAALCNFSDQLQDYMSSGRGASGPQGLGSPNRELSPGRGANAREEMPLGSEEEEKKERAPEKRKTIKVPLRGSVARMERPDEGQTTRGPEDDATRQSRKKEEAAKQARESALVANRALSGRGPQLVDVPRVDLRAREDPQKPDLGVGYGRLRGHSFLDDIGTVGSDDLMEVPKEGTSRQEKDRGRRPGGGGGHSEDDDDRRDRRGREKKRKRSRSSSSAKKARPRGSAVIAPSNKRKRKHKGSGDRGSDPSSSSGSKRDAKKDDRRKKNSRSPRKRRRGDKQKKDVKKRKKASSRKTGRRSSSGSRSSNSQDELYGHETSKYESLVEGQEESREIATIWIRADGKVFSCKSRL